MTDFPVLGRMTLNGDMLPPDPRNADPALQGDFRDQFARLERLEGRTRWVMRGLVVSSVVAPLSGVAALVGLQWNEVLRVVRGVPW